MMNYVLTCVIVTAIEGRKEGGWENYVARMGERDIQNAGMSKPKKKHLNT
jgi:hypothetical protein